MNQQNVCITCVQNQRERANIGTNQPYEQSSHRMGGLIQEDEWIGEQLAESVDDFTIDDLQQFIPQFLAQGIFIESIMFGNITPKVSFYISFSPLHLLSYIYMLCLSN